MKTAKRPSRVVVAGAGLVGSLLAILLKKRGHDVVLHERRSDPRAKGYVGGRSINLALSDRGLLALELAGIGKEIEEVAVAMPGRLTHAIDGASTFLPYGLNGEAIRSVSRGGLNIRLLDLVEQAGVPIHFAQVCTGVSKGSLQPGSSDKPMATFVDDQGATSTTTADIVVGADGAFSAVRRALQETDRFDFSQTYLEHGYKELAIPPGPGGSFLLEKHALHIWPRSSYMMIALPNLDGSFTCTLFFRFESGGSGTDAAFASFTTLDTPNKARSFFAQTFPDALALMPDFDEQWRNNPSSSLCTVRCYPWSRAGKVMLIGDAAHAVVPFFGQGMNCGFEDCRVLMEVLDECDDDWAVAMPRYEQARKENADAIATLALENFVEMRDKVSDPDFVLRKKVEAVLARLCPDKLIPSYTMVTFRPHLPYAEALGRSRAQDRVLDAVLQDPTLRSTYADEPAAPRLKALVDQML